MTKIFQILEVSKVGGKNAYEFVKRNLSQILTNELAAKYSWLGKKNKRVFRILKLSQLIISMFLIIRTYNNNNEASLFSILTYLFFKTVLF